LYTEYPTPTIDSNFKLELFMAIIKSKIRESRVNLEDVLPLDGPFSLYIDPSSACNFSCNFCPTGHEDLVKQSYTRRTLRFETFKSIIDGLQEFPKPLKVLRLNKIGEPTLNKRLVDMIRYARASGRVEWIDLATNGSLLGAEYLKELNQSGLNRLNVSLEGLTDSDYLLNAKVKFRVKDLIINLENLRRQNPDFEILIKIPSDFVRSQKRKELFYETFDKLADFIFIEELSDIWPEFEVADRAGVAGKSVTQYQTPLKKSRQVCTVIMYSLTINSDATVSACCSDWDQKIILGDLSKNSLKEIWYGKEHQDLIMQHLDLKRKIHPVCSKCGHVTNAQVDDIDDYAGQIREKFRRQFRAQDHNLII
jgi:radical SAM protein with 4Fe4S-binding SPASM domain